MPGTGGASCSGTGGVVIVVTDEEDNGAEDEENAPGYREERQTTARGLFFGFFVSLMIIVGRQSSLVAEPIDQPETGPPRNIRTTEGGDIRTTEGGAVTQHVGKTGLFREYGRCFGSMDVVSGVCYLEKDFRLGKLLCLYVVSGVC